LFAATKKHFFAGFGRISHWREAGIFMAAIAKWLFCTFATGAPEIIFTFFNLDRHWRFLRIHSVAHIIPLYLASGFGMWQSDHRQLCCLTQNPLMITGAGNGVRTRDPELGKLVLYQLSYTRTRPHTAHFPTIRQAEILPLLADLTSSHTGNGKNRLQ
jgi:hypothetical protein